MGQLDKLDKQVGKLQRLVNGFDLIGFANTGNVDLSVNPPCISEHFKCISVLNRPYNPAKGGVGCYVKKWLVPHVEVVREYPELGIMWVHINQLAHDGSDLYVAIVYLPPSESTYYTSVLGVGRDKHWDQLLEDIRLFNTLGKVVMIGDFNARTASGDEGNVGSVGVEEDGLKGVDITCRKSMDMHTNVMGKELLLCCRKGGLVIGNGRLPGDEEGAFTFSGFGRKEDKLPSSTIDYIIMSHELCFQDGKVRDGLSMHVKDFKECPCRDNGMRFDHKPVSVTLLLDVLQVKQIRAGKVTTSKEGDTIQPSHVLRWRDEIRQEYVDAISYDGECLAFRLQIYDPEKGVEESLASLTKLVWSAASVVHRKYGKVITVRKQNRDNSCSVHSNSWFNEECRKLRIELKGAERQVPRNDCQILELRRKYRACIKKGKANFREQRSVQLFESLYKDPKKFWKTFQSPAKHSNTLTITNWTKYFAKLYGNNTSKFSHGVNYEEHFQQFPEFFIDPSNDALLQAASLNVEISEDEVYKVLCDMGIGKAPGPDGVCGDFICRAFNEIHFVDHEGKYRMKREFVLIREVTALFNKIFLSGCYPNTWMTSALTPVPKPKGDANNMDHYRGIAVGNALSKLYSAIFMNRIDEWSEQLQIRAKGQFGFRKNRGTIDATFVLKTIIDKFNVEKKPLFTAFIDFRKAYDSVDRKVLWQSLYNMGIHGRSLETLQNMYKDVRMQVRYKGQLGEVFDCKVGVKQGDPISPLLFGLLIDRFESYLYTKMPRNDIVIDNMCLHQLFYADDLVIMADSSLALQQKIDHLRDFCNIMGFSVNTGKSECMVFNKSYGPKCKSQWKWKFGEHELKTVLSFVYLGLLFTDTEEQCFMNTLSSKGEGKARGAWFSLYGKCQNIRLFNPHLLCRLFDCNVLSVFNYGCELWIPSMVIKCKGNLNKGVGEDLHKLFMRMTLLVGKSTPIAPMMEELRRTPFLLSGIKRVVTYWNRIALLDQSSIIRKALNENINLAARNVGWVSNVMKMLLSLGITQTPNVTNMCVHSMINHIYTKWYNVAWSDLVPRSLVHRCRNSGRGAQLMEKSEEGRLLESAMEFDDDSRGMLSEGTIAQDITTSEAVRMWSDEHHVGFKLRKYKAWFGNGKTEMQVLSRKDGHFTEHLHSCQKIRMVSAFRLGKSWLNCETMRKSENARSKRLCTLCDRMEIEDELHILFCTTYACIRERFSDIFNSDAYIVLKTLYEAGVVDFRLDHAMKTFMNSSSSSFWNMFAAFLIQAREVRESRCHHS